MHILPSCWCTASVTSLCVLAYAHSPGTTATLRAAEVQNESSIEARWILGKLVPTCFDPGHESIAYTTHGCSTIVTGEGAFTAFAARDKKGHGRAYFIPRLHGESASGGSRIQALSADQRHTTTRAGFRSADCFREPAAVHTIPRNARANSTR